MDDRLSVGEEGEDVVVETAEFLLNGYEQPGVGDCGGNLQPVSDDAAELHQPVDVLRCHACHPLYVEVVESRSVTFAFAEDCNPGQPCLGAFEYQKFEQGPVVGNGPSPLFVVVFDVQFVAPGPAAACVDDVVHLINLWRGYFQKQRG